MGWSRCWWWGRLLVEFEEGASTTRPQSATLPYIRRLLG